MKRSGNGTSRESCGPCRRRRDAVRGLSRRLVRRTSVLLRPIRATEKRRRHPLESGCFLGVVRRTCMAQPPPRVSMRFDCLTAAQSRPRQRTGGCGALVLAWAIARGRNAYLTPHGRISRFTERVGSRVYRILTLAGNGNLSFFSIASRAICSRTHRRSIGSLVNGGQMWMRRPNILIKILRTHTKSKPQSGADDLPELIAGTARLHSRHIGPDARGTAKLIDWRPRNSAPTCPGLAP